MLQLLSFTAILAGSLVHAAPATYVPALTGSGSVLMIARTVNERGVNFNWGGEKVRGVNLG